MEKTNLQKFVLAAIRELPVGTTIRLHELYKTIENFLSGGNRPSAPEHVIEG